MSWARLDDQLNTNRKMAEIDNDAYAVWVSGIVHCAQHLTDGLLTKAEVALLCRLRNVSNADSNAVTNALVTAGLWEEVENGYRVHDYLTYNPSREQVLRERDSTRSRQERFRQSKKTARSSHDNEEHNAVTNGVTNGVTNAPVTPAPYPVPVPMDPLVTNVTNGATVEAKNAAHAAPPSGGKQSPKPTSKQERPKHDKASHNAMFESIIETYGIDLDAINRTERGMVNAVATNLLDSHLTPDDVPRLKACIQAKFPNMGTIPPTMLPKYVYTLNEPAKTNGTNGHRAVDKSSVKGEPSTLANDFRAKQAREEAAKAGAG